MGRQEIRALIAVRPASESLREAAAAAAYVAVLEAQRAGKPSSAKAQILMAYVDEARSMSAALDGLENAGEA